MTDVEKSEDRAVAILPVRYAIEMTSTAWLALVRHGYDPTLPARGTSGGPGRKDGYLIGIVDGKPVYMPLRNHVCYLDGIEIDGHTGSDLDPTSTYCIHCGDEGSHP